MCFHHLTTFLSYCHPQNSLSLTHTHTHTETVNENWQRSLNSKPLWLLTPGNLLAAAGDKTEQIKNERQISSLLEERVLSSIQTTLAASFISFLVFSLPLNQVAALAIQYKWIKSGKVLFDAFEWLLGSDTVRLSEICLSFSEAIRFSYVDMSVCLCVVHSRLIMCQLSFLL